MIESRDLEQKENDKFSSNEDMDDSTSSNQTDSEDDVPISLLLQQQFKYESGSQ